ADAVFLEVGDVGIAAQEPQQFVDDRPQVQLLRRQDGEAFLEIEAHLVAEHGTRAGSGTIPPVRAVFHHVREEIEILLHAAAADSVWGRNIVAAGSRSNAGRALPTTMSPPTSQQPARPSIILQHHPLFRGDQKPYICLAGLRSGYGDKRSVK